MAASAPNKSNNEKRTGVSTMLIKTVFLFFNGPLNLLYLYLFKVNENKKTKHFVNF